MRRLLIVAFVALVLIIGLSACDDRKSFVVSKSVYRVDTLYRYQINTPNDEQRVSYSTINYRVKDSIIGSLI